MEKGREGEERRNTGRKMEKTTEEEIECIWKEIGSNIGSKYQGLIFT